MKTYAPLLTLDPLQELAHLQTQISHESFSVLGIKRAVYDLMPSLQQHFQGFLNHFSKNEPAVKLKSDERAFLKLLEGRVYLNLAPLTAYVPEGLSVTYLDYLRVLQAALEHCHAVTLPALNDYSVQLAQIITNRQLVVTMMPKTASYVAMEKTRTEQLTALSKCFTTGSSKAQATYGDVVERNNQWVDVFQTLGNVDRLANSLSRDKLYQKAEECNAQLQTIIRQIRDGHYEQAGPEVLNNLAAGAYQAGAELEFFAATYYRVLTMTQAVSDTMNQTVKVLKAA